jgi:lipopolysaccharide export system permease protein
LGKQIDKYIVVSFAKIYLFALLCFILIFILIDLFETLDRFIDNRIPASTIISYYYYYTPEIIKLVTPVAVLLATLFTAGSMVNYNEIIALKNTGISLIRFMLPFLSSGIVITSFSMYFNNWVVPEANKKKFYIERNLLRKNITTIGLNKLYFQQSENQFLLIENFREQDLTAEQISLQVYSGDNAVTMIKRIDAKEMKWQDNRWILNEAVERKFTANYEKLIQYQTIPLDSVKEIEKITIKPEHIIRKRLKPDEMNYGELEEFISGMIKAGQNTDRQMVDFYSKTAFPFSSIIVIILGIAVSTYSRQRRGLAMQFGICILISFIYLGFSKISHSFGYNGDLNPLFTAWLANLVFAAVGITLLYRNNY